MALLHAPLNLVHNEAFNVGVNSENYQVRDIAQIVQHTVPNCELAFASDAEPDTRTYRVDFSKIARLIPNSSRSGRRQRAPKNCWPLISRLG